MVSVGCQGGKGPGYVGDVIFFRALAHRRDISVVQQCFHRLFRSPMDGLLVRSRRNRGQRFMYDDSGLVYRASRFRVPRTFVFRPSVSTQLHMSPPPPDGRSPAPFGRRFPSRSLFLPRPPLAPAPKKATAFPKTRRSLLGLPLPEALARPTSPGSCSPRR